MGLQMDPAALVSVKDTRQSTEYRGNCINRPIPPLLYIVNLPLHRQQYTFTVNISQIWHNWLVDKPYHLSAQHLLWSDTTSPSKNYGHTINWIISLPLIPLVIHCASPFDSPLIRLHVHFLSPTLCTNIITKFRRSKQLRVSLIVS